MRLQRLTGLEREKIVQDYKTVLAWIEKLKAILASEELVYKIIREELQEIRQKYGDKRRTEIVIDDSAGDLNIEDLISDDETLVTITHTGYIKRSDLDQFRRQNRGGKGVKGVTTTETDFVSAIYKTTNLSDLLCFTDRGRMYRVKVYQIPEASRSAKGRAIVNLLSLQPGENVRAILPVREFKESEYVVFVTSQGVIKKTPLSDFKNVRTSGIIAITIEEGDTLVSANLTDGQKEIFLCSKEGKCIRFGEDEVRAMGRTARGVHGMSLDDGDVIVATEVLDPNMPEGEILTVTDAGYGKRTPISDYRKQSRAGKGVLSMNLSERNGHVMSCAQVMPNDEVMLVSSKGKMIRISVAGISELGRVTQGVKLISLEPTERVVALELIADQQDESKH
jgi:DNA gyrase subunit A